MQNLDFAGVVTLCGRGRNDQQVTFIVWDTGGTSSYYLNYGTRKYLPHPLQTTIVEVFTSLPESVC
ncbi:MAG: hypothetical protein FJ012_06375 [Chloroflexi bacterium]|nr:hypothetical protein [Chloroflexota bacterium]